MNVLAIALKEMKQNIRDIRTLVFMLAFPIVLMLILGTALSTAFNTDISIGTIHVLYKNTAGAELTSYFQAFAKEAKKSGILFAAADENIDGKKEVQENHYSAYVELSNSGITLYGSSRNNIEESILQGMLSAFADKYDLAAAVASVDPAKVGTALTSGTADNYIKETALTKAKEPSSMDYYAITMSTMIALYGAIYASTLIRSERTRNTALRLAAAPIGKWEIFLGKIIGCFTINFLSLLAVVGVSHFVFKANWGNHIGIVILVLVTEVILAVSFGLGISYIAKTGEASRMIIMIVIQVASFFGGAYFKIVGAAEVTQFSPLTWANDAITKIIYENDITAAIPAISLNLGISVLFLAIAIISFQRREGL